MSDVSDMSDVSQVSEFNMPAALALTLAWTLGLNPRPRLKPEASSARTAVNAREHPATAAPHTVSCPETGDAAAHG